MSDVPKKQLTAEEYLEFERNSEIKHEFYNGRIYAMAGAKRNHNKIAANLHGLLWQHLKGKKCEFYPSEMRVLVARFGLYAYPDVSVVCGKPDFQDAVLDTLLNPVLLIEILSDSTESYDRGKKFQHYRRLKAFRSMCLFRRMSSDRKVHPPGRRFLGASLEAVGIESSIMFESIDCPISLAEVYDKIDFDEPEEDEAE